MDLAAVHRGLAAGGEQERRTDAVEGDRTTGVAWHEPGEREGGLADVVGPDARRLVERLRGDREPGVEAQRPQQLGDVDVLGGEPAPQHVVRRRHQLDAGALQVGVQVAGGQVDPLPRLQVQQVEQQRAEAPRVAGVLARQAADPGVRVPPVARPTAIARAPRRPPLGRPRRRSARRAAGPTTAPLGCRQDRRCARASRSGSSGLDAEPLDELQRLGRLAEPAERPRVDERHEQLGLRVRVAVGAVRVRRAGRRRPPPRRTPRGPGPPTDGPAR